MNNIELSPDVLNELEAKLGVSFANRMLLRQALVHRSLVNEAEMADADCNERMEFLGDAALGLVAAQTLYERFPDRAEGKLSRARAALVNLSTLARFARELELGRFLQLGRGEARSGGRSRNSVLARALEAVVGALYLDRGLVATRDFLTPLLERELDRYGWEGPAKDFKTRLQEFLQAAGHEPPGYELLAENGPDHAKNFRISVLVDGAQIGEGEGSSKQRAEQAAARAALLSMEAKEGSADVSAAD